jgi:hypothetical protein
MAKFDASRRICDDSFPNDGQLEEDHEDGVAGMLGQPGPYSRAVSKAEALHRERTHDVTAS